MTAVRLFLFVVLSTLLGACGRAPGEQGSADFTSSLSGDVRPWTHENFDAADDKFTFAVVSDLTGGERDRIFEIAIAQLNLLRPELIMNVGDLIEGDSKDEAGLAAEWGSF